MAYSRFGDSDLYLYGSVFGGYDCALCKLHPDGRSINLDTIEEVFEHVLEHIKAGHEVNSYTLIRICDELAISRMSNDDFFKPDFEFDDGRHITLVKQETTGEYGPIKQVEISVDGCPVLSLDEFELAHVYRCGMKIFYNREV
jgi:hypothetical protein